MPKLAGFMRKDRLARGGFPPQEERSLDRCRGTGLGRPSRALLHYHRYSFGQGVDRFLVRVPFTIRPSRKKTHSPPSHGAAKPTRVLEPLIQSDSQWRVLLPANLGHTFPQFGFTPELVLLGLGRDAVPER